MNASKSALIWSALVAGMPWGETWVRFYRAVSQLFDRDGAAGFERADLIVEAVHDHYRNVDRFEIVEEIRFGQRLHAIVLRFDSAHHSLPPPIVANALRNFCAGTVETVKRHGDVLVELRAVISGAAAELIKNFHRHAVRIFFTFQKQRRNGTDQYGFGDAAFSVARDVTGDFAAAGGVADVHRVFQVELGGEFGDVRGVSIHVIADGGL